MLEGHEFNHLWDTLESLQKQDFYARQPTRSVTLSSPEAASPRLSYTRYTEKTTRCYRTWSQTRRWPTDSDDWPGAWTQRAATQPPQGLTRTLSQDAHRYTFRSAVPAALAHGHRKTWARTARVAMFTLTEKWTLPKCLAAGGYTNQVVYSHLEAMQCKRVRPSHKQHTDEP